MKLKRLLTLALASLLVASLCGCGLFDKQKDGKDKKESSQTEERESDPGYPVSAGGITLQYRPSGVVSLAPSLTEKLYDLGMGSCLLGVSDYCDYPEEVVALPICGTAQTPGLDKLAELKPELVLTEAELPEEAMAALENMGIPVAVLPRAETVDALMETYLTLARLIDGDSTGYETGDNLVKEYRGRLNSLNKTLSSYTEKNGRKKVIYLRLMDFTIATGDTFESQLMSIICLDNVAADYTGWSYPESAKAELSGVDVIYMDKSAVTIKDLEGSPIYKGLTATIKDQYLYISSLELERQSLRTLDVLEAMAAYAYPGADVASGGGNDESQDMADTADNMRDG